MEGQLTHIGNVIPYRYDAAKKHKIKQITLLQLVCFQGNCVFHGQFWRSHMHEAQSGAITLNKLFLRGRYKRDKKEDIAFSDITEFY